MNRIKTISIIEKNIFISQWAEAENYNSNHGRHDQNACNRINIISDTTRTFQISLIEIEANFALDKIIIPYHKSSDHLFTTNVNGNTLKEFTEKYSYDNLKFNNHNACIKSTTYHIERFRNQKNSFLEGTFMYCTQNVELSPDKNSRKGQYLYAGSFHQFAAYALFIKKFGAIPLRLYLCNKVAQQ